MIDGKRIAIDARMIEMSGIGRYIQHLMGHGIYDAALGDEKLIRKYDRNVKVIPFQEKIYSVGEQVRFPCRSLKNEQIDIVHFPHYNVPFCYQGSYVVTIHDLIHLKYPEYLKNAIARRYAKMLMRHAVYHAEHIFTVSEYSKKDLIDYFHIPEDKITVTYNAADHQFHRKKSEKVEYLRSKYHIANDKKIILYVGNLKPHKNLKTLLEAYTKLKHQSRYILILVGKAFEHNRTRDTELRYGIKSGVITTGTVDNETLVDLYNIADLFVLPSLYEGFGIPPLEAMACGTPVICSSTSSLPEVVGNAALLFDPRNADELAQCIERLSEDTTLYSELVERGFLRVRMFDWDKTVSQTKNMIRTVMKHSRG